MAMNLLQLFLLLALAGASKGEAHRLRDINVETLENDIQLVVIRSPEECHITSRVYVEWEGFGPQISKEYVNQVVNMQLARNGKDPFVHTMPGASSACQLVSILLSFPKS